MFRFFGAALLILVVLFVLGVSQTIAPSRPSPSPATVLFGDTSFVLNVADTPARPAHGLSDRADIPERGGMLFLFNGARARVFWMKDMLVAIDIVWVRGDEIIGFVENAAPPSSDTRDDVLAIFPTPDLAPGQKVTISVP